MPTYKYICQSCAAGFQVDASIREMEEGTAAKFACPACDSRSIKRIFSVGSFLKNIMSADKKTGCSGGSCRGSEAECAACDDCPPSGCSR